MSYLFIEYPKCTTCKKAKKYLTDNKIDFTSRHIVEDNPSAEELKKWIELSGEPVKKAFNTSGNMYKELNLKDKLADMSDDEKYKLLATNGMLVKRPIIVGEDFAFFGFKEDKWSEKLCK